MCGMRVKDRIDESEEAFLLVDDSVHNKQYWHAIETVKLQYSGNEHGLVKGIGLVNLVPTNGFEGYFYPLDYRVYDREADGKTKNEHFREMFIRANSEKRIRGRNIAFESWYARVDNLKLIHRSDWTFFRGTAKQSSGEFIKRDGLSRFRRC